MGTVDLVDKIPWSKTYKPPQTDVFFQNTMNMVEGFSAGMMHNVFVCNPL